MRTTLSIDDGLLEDAKKVAAQTGRSLARFVEDALRESLARSRQQRTAEPTRLHTIGGKGLLPGVDLDDSAALQDVMDADDSH